MTPSYSIDGLSSRRVRGGLRALALAAALAAAWPAAALAGNDRTSGVVYVESNIGTPSGNSILAFRRGPDGSLAPLPGSPFATRAAAASSTCR